VAARDGGSLVSDETKPFESGAAAFNREHAAIYAGVSTHIIDKARAEDQLLATSPHTEPRYTKANLDKWIERWPALPARK
jgi:hypothetical protein